MAISSSRPQRTHMQVPYLHNMEVSCKFKPNNTSAPTLQSSRGVATVARADVGVYTVTLNDPYYSLEDVFCQLHRAASATQYFASVTGYSVANKTFTVKFLTEAGVATDVTGGTDEFCSFRAWLKLSELEPAGG